jgi:hypothetical protein
MDHYYKYLAQIKILDAIKPGHLFTKKDFLLSRCSNFSLTMRAPKVIPSKYGSENIHLGFDIQGRRGETRFFRNINEEDFFLKRFPLETFLIFILFFLNYTRLKPHFYEKKDYRANHTDW